MSLKQEIAVEAFVGSLTYVPSSKQVWGIGSDRKIRIWNATVRVINSLSRHRASDTSA
mgnify:CR=1 FL=1